jgi:hypothetical protein
LVRRLKNIKNHLIEIVISFILYWIFAGYLWFFPELRSGVITYFIFLPAGVKLFAVLVFQWRGAVGTGIAIFSRLMITDSTQPWISWLIVAVTVSIALYVVVQLVLMVLGVEKNLSNFHYYQIVLLAAITSITNGFTFAYVVNSLTNSEMSSSLFHSGFNVVIGNFIGNALFVCGALLIMQKKVAIVNFIKKFG